MVKSIFEKFIKCRCCNKLNTVNYTKAEQNFIITDYQGKEWKKICDEIRSLELSQLYKLDELIKNSKKSLSI